MSRVSDLVSFIKPLLQKEKSLKEDEVETIHFFRREYNYTCYGHQAIALAEEYYKTKRVIRIDQGLDCLDVSRKLFSRIGGSLLERHLKIKVWHKTSSSNSAPWELKLVATHGNFEALEDEVGKLERDITSSCFLCAIMSDDLRPSSMGLAIISTVTREVHLYEYEDDESYSKLESLLLQYGISVCVLLRKTDPSNEDNSPHAKSMIEKIIIKAGSQVEYFNISNSKYNKNSTIAEVLSMSNVGSDSNSSTDLQLKLLQLSQSLLAIHSISNNLGIWGNKEHHGTYNVTNDCLESFMEYDANVSEALQLFPEDIRDNLIQRIDDGDTVTKGKLRSLLDLLHTTKCSMGSRLLRNWIQHPLCNSQQIIERQDLVSIFVENPTKLCILRDSKDHLKSFPDLERIVQRLRSVKLSTPAGVILKDMVDLYKAITKAKSIQSVVNDLPQNERNEIHRINTQLSELLNKYTRYLNLVEELLDIDHMQNIINGRANVDKVSGARLLLHRDRFYRIKPTFSAELHSIFDSLLEVESSIFSEYQNAQKLTSLDQKELHLEDSDIHGWHFRVTKRVSSKILKSLDSQKIPYDILSNQKAGTLFVTKKLKALLVKYESLRTSYQEMQRDVVIQALTVTKTYFSSILELSKLVATIDVASSLASIALEKDWTRPQVLEGESHRIEITHMKHPLLEEQIGSLTIVKNSVQTNDEKFVAIISGPNMGGKSTFMRTIGIISFLTQIGSFVPATEAKLPIFDKIFVRAGSRDCSLLGVSSFMAEMNDTADILRSATSKSLVLIDELGRGTSINDGFGIAWAILEELGYRNKATTFCATHYHELNLLQDDNQSLKSSEYNGFPNPFFCLHVKALVDEKTDSVAMLYEVHDGPSDSSYGIHVAKAAKFPSSIISKAIEIEQGLEGKHNFGEKRNLNCVDEADFRQKRQKCN